MHLFTVEPARFLLVSLHQYGIFSYATAGAGWCWPSDYFPVKQMRMIRFDANTPSISAR